METKIIKLVNGDDVVCTIPTEQDTKSKWLSIVKPMQIKYVPKLTMTGITDYVALVKWTAYSPDEQVSIPKDKIMTITAAGDSLNRSYTILAKDFHLQEVQEEQKKSPVSEQDKLYNKSRVDDETNKKINESFDILDFEDADGKLH